MANSTSDQPSKGSVVVTVTPAQHRWLTQMAAFEDEHLRSATDRELMALLGCVSANAQTERHIPRDEAVRPETCWPHLLRYTARAFEL